MTFVVNAVETLERYLRTLASLIPAIALCAFWNAFDTPSIIETASRPPAALWDTCQHRYQGTRSGAGCPSGLIARRWDGAEFWVMVLPQSPRRRDGV